ncbi:hypothetical protein ScPMuIL_010009 [Solemya velum]
MAVDAPLSKAVVFKKADDTEKTTKSVIIQTFRETWHTYAVQTTLHGVRHLADKKNGSVCRDFIRGNDGPLKLYQVGNREGLLVALSTEQKDYFIGDDAAAGFRILVHDPYEEPAMSEFAIAISPRTSTFIAIEQTKISFLPSPVKAFGDDVCLDTEDPNFVNFLKFYDTYSYSACLIECRSNYTISACGCKEIFHPGDATVCDPITLWRCVPAAKANLSMSNHFTCQCRMPCKVSQYDTKISSAQFPRKDLTDFLGANYKYQGQFGSELSENLLELRVYYVSRLYNVHEQVLDMTDSDLWASIGGYLGMFLGASFHSALEFFEFLYTSVATYFTRKQRFSF